MPRSGWLAVGAVSAALGAPTASSGFGRGRRPALALAILAVVAGTLAAGHRTARMQRVRREPRTGRALPVVARRRGRRAPAPDRLPDRASMPAIPAGDGPWPERRGRRRDPEGRTADRDDRDRARSPPRRRDAAALPGDRARRRGRRPGDAWSHSPGRRRLRHLPAADRGHRDAPGALPRPARHGRGPGGRDRGPSAHGGRGPDAVAPRTRGRARGRDPHRAARPGRSRPGAGVHDGRGQPRRRDLGLEHRDRRLAGRRHSFARRTGAPQPFGRHAPGDRRLHHRGGGVAVRRPRRGDGRRGHPRPGVGTGRGGRHRTRLGRRPAPRRGADDGAPTRGSSCRCWRPAG